MTLSSTAGEAASNSRCKRRAIRKRLKEQKEKSGKLPVDLVKLAKIAISPVRGKGLAECKVVSAKAYLFPNSDSAIVSSLFLLQK
jgi:hypothetical protein